MPAVVSDTSPLIYLTRLGHFDWLRQMFGHVLIPPSVWSELVNQGAAYPEAAQTKAAVEAGWIKVVSPTSAIPALRGLDPGEREAIALAKELSALLIIDDAEGRREAVERGVQVVGTVGLLLEAKARGLVSTLRGELDRLAQETTFRISDELRARVLQKAGESEP